MDQVPLAEITTVHIERALGRLGGIKSLYEDVLVKLPADMEEIVERIQDSWQRGDLIQVKRELHTLRSVAGFIGADGFANHALCLETRLGSEKDTETFKLEIKTLSSQCQTIIAHIKKFSTTKPQTYF